MTAGRRLTQRDIARLAGVSQATVSLVLNGSASAEGRIPAETRERVTKVIRDTGYVADPVARRMAKGLNRILGVFTYEPAFPRGQADFFTPFLFGIEDCAQQHGYDLLLLTAGAPGGHRKIFHENNRLRLADGCIILGREFDRAELARLVAGDYPFVAIGRRDDAGGPVPYVGSDYAKATAELVRRAQAMGHRKLAFVGPSEGAESTRDRWRGFNEAIGDCELVLHVPSAGRPPAEIVDAIAASGATVAFISELADAVLVAELARHRGIAIPEDLSIIVLGSHIRAAQSGTSFTSFDVPREEMGWRAAELLTAMIEKRDVEQQVLLACEPVEGDTLGPASERTDK